MAGIKKSVLSSFLVLGNFIFFSADDFDVESTYRANRSHNRSVKTDS